MADAGIVGVAYVEIRPLLTNFGAATEAELNAGGATATDLTVAGEDAGAALGTGIGSAADRELANYKIGTSGLLGPDGRPLASSLTMLGEDAGAGLATGIGAGAGDALDTVGKDLASQGGAVAGALSTSLGSIGTDAGTALGAGIGAGAGEALAKERIGAAGLLGVDTGALYDSGLVAGASLGKGIETGASTELALAMARIDAELKAGAAFSLPVLGSSLAKYAPEAEVAGSGIVAAFGKGLSKLGAVAESAELPFAAALNRAGTSVSAVSGKVGALEGGLAKLGKVSLIAGGALAVGVGYESIKLAQSFQQATYQIAAGADISNTAAAKIGQAFLSTAGTAFESANTIASAYAQVAGQLGKTAGQALNASQALRFMNTSLDLAEATGADLSSTTSALSQVMQGFALNLDQADYASNVLFNTSRFTNTGLSTIVTTVDRLRGRLDVAKPSLGDISALMVELAKNGIVGGRGVQLVSTGLNKLLGDSTATQKELASLGSNGGAIASLDNQLATLKTTVSTSSSALDPFAAKISAAKLQITALGSSKPNLDEFKAEIAQARASIASLGTASPGSAAAVEIKNLRAEISGWEADEASLTATTSGSSTAVGKLRTQIAGWEADEAKLKLSTGDVNNSLSDQKKRIEAEISTLSKQQVSLFNAKGQFVGMAKAIGILHTAFENLTPAQQDQAATTLFGAGAAGALIKVINEGPAVFIANQKAVEKANSAHAAAIKNSRTLKRETEVLGSALEDFGTKIGLKVIPKLADFVGWLNKDVTWLEKNKGAASDLAHAVEVILGGAIAVFVGTKVVSFVSGLGKIAKALQGVALGEAAAGTAGAEGAGGVSAFAAGLSTLVALGAGLAAFEGTLKLLNILHPTVKPTGVLGTGSTQALSNVGLTPADIAGSTSSTSRNPLSGKVITHTGAEVGSGTLRLGSTAQGRAELAAVTALRLRTNTSTANVEKAYPSLAELRKYAATIHVHPSPGMNEQQLATAVSRRLSANLKGH